MIRVYKEFLEKAMVCLAYLKLTGIELRDAASYAQDRGRSLEGLVNHDRLVTASYSILKGASASGVSDSVDEMLALMDKQLEQHGGDLGEQKYADLIDVMVNVLQLPYLRSNFNSKRLEQMKRALLLPDELNALKVNLKKKERYCMGCNHQFKNGESVVYSMGDGGDPGLLCTTCLQPQWIRCQRCEGWVPLTEKDRGFFRRKFNCGQHAEGGLATPAGNPIDVEEGLPPWGPPEPTPYRVTPTTTVTTGTEAAPTTVEQDRTSAAYRRFFGNDGILNETQAPPVYAVDNGPAVAAAAPRNQNRFTPPEGVGGGTPDPQNAYRRVVFNPRGRR